MPIQKNTPVARAITKGGGYKVVSKRLGTSVNVLLQWVFRDQVPAHHAEGLARLAGVHPHTLRPDVFSKRVRLE